MTKGPGAQPRFLLLGEILRPHGVRGEVRMRLLTDYPERISHLEHVYIGSSPDAAEPVRHVVQHMRMHQNYGLLKLKTIDDRNAAERLRALMVMVTLEDAVPLEADEIYLYQLINLTVQTETGETLGVITDVLETGANDVYIIDSPAYGEVLIPVTDETIIKTDIEAGIVIVQLPEGLLPGR
jgi:16S rRNA processing protein RimM